LGAKVRSGIGVSLPAPVIGFAVLALLVVTLERFHPSTARRFRTGLEPSVRLLLSHMGLLFVPAGAGLLTQGALLSRQWLPISAGLLLSTLLGLVVTAGTCELAARRETR
jgi:holin-like protein